MKFHLFASRRSKLEIIGLILIATFLLLNSTRGQALWGKKIKELSEDELKKIKAELNIPEDPRFHSYSDPDLKEVLDKEIDSQEGPGLTYGVFILSAINEEKLVDLCSKKDFVHKDASEFFSTLTDNLASWQKNFAEKTTKMALEGVIKVCGGSGVSIGISSLFLALDLVQIGVSIKKLDELLYTRALWHYIACRKIGYYSHEDAWDSIASVTPIKYRNPQTKEYFKSLWDKYGEHISEDGLNEDFKHQQHKILKMSVLYALGAKAHPVVTSPLKITPPPPYHAGDGINAEFTITNKGTAPITFNILTVGGRDPDSRVADFTFRRDITLSPNKSYNYKGSLTLAKAGNYHFFCAYQTPGGKWNPSVDLGPGLTDEDRTEDITVKAKVEEPPKKPIIKVSKGSKSYYPLDEGKTWEYQALLKEVDRLGESRTLEKVVITNFPQRELKGEKVTPRRTEVKIETSSYTSFLFYAEDENGICTVAFQKPGQVEPEMLSSRDYFIKDPIEVGASWSSMGTFFVEPEIPTSVKTTIESVDEVVTVSAGTFKECLKFYIIAFAEKKDLDDNSTFRIDAQAYLWLAPGVGLIKMIYKDKSTLRLPEFLTSKSAEMTMQLEKFK